MKLNTDNPNTMPVTDSVYGPRPKRADKPERPRRERTLGEALDTQTLAALAAAATRKKRRRR